MSRPDQPAEPPACGESAIPSLLGSPGEGLLYTKTKPLPFGVTLAMSQALHWLLEHGGSGVFDKRQRLLSQGELYAGEPVTWQRLRDRRLLDAEGFRLTVNKAGQEHCRQHPLAQLTSPFHEGRVEPLPGAE